MVLWLSRFACAAAVSVFGSSATGYCIGDTGTLQIVFDTGPENRTFMNGGIGLELTVDNPGVIHFTSANVINDGRWSVVQNGNVTTYATGTLSAFSVFSPGLPSGPHVIFAKIGYEVIGAGGTSIFVAPSGEEPLYDGTIPPFGADVSNEFSFIPTFIFTCPEPGTLAMAGMGLIGLMIGRRNG